MGRIRTRLPKRGTLILLWVGGLILLGVVGWGIGWTAHRLLDRREPPPTPRPTATYTPGPAATGVPTVTPTEPGAPDDALTPTVVGPDGTVQPTSTLLPKPTLIAEENEVVQAGDGMLKVCRRHCPERWPPDDDELTTYAQQVTELNGMSWPDPALSPRQILKMPPCPGK